MPHRAAGASAAGPATQGDPTAPAKVARPVEARQGYQVAPRLTKFIGSPGGEAKGPVGAPAVLMPLKHSKGGVVTAPRALDGDLHRGVPSLPQRSERLFDHVH
jgi:hypothetical protein